MNELYINLDNIVELCEYNPQLKAYIITKQELIDLKNKMMKNE